MSARKPRSARPSLESAFDSLFGALPDSPHGGSQPAESQPAGSARLMLIDRGCIRTGAQPRQSFPPHEIGELSRSITELRDRGAGIEGTGILQPLLVAPVEGEGEGHYRLIAGERRWRAAGEAGLEWVPVVVVPLHEETVLLAQLVENLQRRDLPPLEEARGLGQLMEARQLSVRDAAKVVGKPKSYLSDRLALLKMGEDVQAMVSERSDTLIHAREVDGVDDPVLRRELIGAIATERLSLAHLRRRIDAAAQAPTSSTGATLDNAQTDERIEVARATLEVPRPQAILAGGEQVRGEGLMSEASERSDTPPGASGTASASRASAAPSPGNQSGAALERPEQSRASGEVTHGEQPGASERNLERNAKSALTLLRAAAQEVKDGHLPSGRPGELERVLEEAKAQINLIQNLLHHKDRDDG